MSFKNKVVVITGASSGIGTATAHKFASLGAFVALMGRNTDALTRVSHEAQLMPPKGKCIVTDVTSEENVKLSVEDVVKTFGRIDVLVNNAGVIAPGMAQDTNTKTWDTNFNTNARGSFMMMQYCLPHLEQTSGNIVNVSSTNGMHSFMGTMAYCSSKAALDMMTKCAAIDLASKGIRVNSVNPGVIRTEFQRRGGMCDKTYEAFAERCKQTHPIGRMGEPEEIAEAIVYLADNSRAGFITGSLLAVDGGRICLGMR
eukprot:PhM_4_TR10570/c0_g1_i1/m.26405